MACNTTHAEINTQTLHTEPIPKIPNQIARISRYYVGSLAYGSFVFSNFIYTGKHICSWHTHTHNVRRFMFLWCISVICIAFSIPNIQLHNEESVNCSIINEKKKKKSFDLSTFFPLILKKFR